jgi:8-oxo-dGTP diphosphatase
MTSRLGEYGMQREYPHQPRVAVGVVVVKNSSVLLVKRGQEPSKGLWSVPGGLIELGETLEDAAQREVREETGINVRIEKLLGVANNIVRDDEGKTRFHYVLIDYLARPLTTSVKAQSDASETKWVDFKDLSSYSVTKGARKLIRKISAMKSD